MRVSREQAAKNRQSVLEKASRSFRECGIDGVGLADLMKSVGLTHGGFYGQFKSKDELVLEATDKAFEESSAERAQLQGSKAERWEAMKTNYLSRLHCDHPGYGCPMTTLAVEAPRRKDGLQSLFTRGIRSFIEDVDALLPQRRAEARREQAMVAVSAMVGAVILARATDDQDLANEILENVRLGI